MSIHQLASASLRAIVIAATLPPRVAAEPCALAFGERSVGRVAADRVVRRFDQRPAQIGRAVLGERAAAVDVARLAHARTEAGVADQLRRCREAIDVADLGGDRVAEHAADPGALISNCR